MIFAYIIFLILENDNLLKLLNGIKAASFQFNCCFDLLARHPLLIPAQ